MSTYLVIDCHFLLYRAHYAMKNLSFDGESTGASFGFFRDILDLRDRFGSDDFVFCFDRGRGKRKDILPSYKSSRRKEWTEKEKKQHTELQRQITKLRTRLLRKLGFLNILSQPGYEADDIIASVVMNSLKGDDDAVIVSSDGDLLQLLSHNVIIYNPAKKKCTNKKSFMKEWGIDPGMWANVKALAGCTSDDIRGVEGVGEKTAVKWFTNRLNPETKKYESINKNLSIYNRNIQLTRLPLDGTEVFELKKDRIDNKQWRGLMDEMGMSSIREVTRRNAEE